MFVTLLRLCAMIRRMSQPSQLSPREALAYRCKLLSRELEAISQEVRNLEPEESDLDDSLKHMAARDPGSVIKIHF